VGGISGGITAVDQVKREIFVSGEQASLLVWKLGVNVRNNVGGISGGITAVDQVKMKNLRVGGTGIIARVKVGSECTE